MKNLIPIMPVGGVSAYIDTFEQQYDTNIEFCDDVIEQYAELRKVAVDNIITGQQEVDEDKVNAFVVAEYYEGAIGISYEGCDEVYLIDGNHRVNASIKAEKEYIDMLIVTIKY